MLGSLKKFQCVVFWLSEYASRADRCLLSCESFIGRHFRERKITTPGVNVNSAAARIARCYHQLLRSALAQYVYENTLDALLVTSRLGTPHTYPSAQEAFADFASELLDHHNQKARA